MKTEQLNFKSGTIIIGQNYNDVKLLFPKNINWEKSAEGGIYPHILFVDCSFYNCDLSDMDGQLFCRCEIVDCKMPSHIGWYKLEEKKCEETECLINSTIN